ncbi:unnamed protein product [Cylindrotheca closterium]|uniref:Kinesin-like protein n=1 Tax=Cylindrotheca closterium TaxID=2856 RepID=A0AAD2CJZ3_9STRA|nr:unnamed protein product [Cylindrotheca closterium]
MNTSMVEDCTIDDTLSSAESSQEFTFSTASTLRRNLAETFDQQVFPPKNQQKNVRPHDLNPASQSVKIVPISDRIQQCEAVSMGRDIKPPLIPSRKLRPNNPIPPDSFSVYLRIRPPDSYMTGKEQADSRKRKMISEQAINTIEIVPPKDPKQNPTTVRTFPPPESNTSKFHSSQRNGQNSASLASAIKEFQFHQVLPHDTSQQDFYSVVAAPLVQNVFNVSQPNHAPSHLSRSGSQNSALLFSYGITNAGKTHTMLGSTTSAPDTSKWGIIPRAISDILDRIKFAAIEQGEASDLFVSCFEVYNEQIFDLLPKGSPMSRVGPPPVLKVREACGQILVRGLAKHKISAVTEGVTLTRTANDRRHTSSNNLNSGSSRSHFICQLQVVPSIGGGVPALAKLETSASGYTTDEEAASMQKRKEATIWLVDLAGSERAKRTGLGSSRQKEASQINKSLLTLMRCLTAMREKGSKSSSNVIPFRESKLTHLFMRHLTGSSSHRTSMVVNVNPSIADFDETQHVLAYASKAKTIQLKPSEMYDKYDSFGAEYDLNGRKKSKTTNIGKHILSKVLGKLSPTNIASRLSPRKYTQHSKNVLQNHFLTVQSDENLQEILVKKGEKITSLKGALDSANAEIEKLRVENAGLIEDLQEQERHIRIEVSEEIEERFKATRARSIQELERLQSKLASDPSLCRSTRKAQMDKTDVRIHELMDQVGECEEEMTRLRKEHASEKMHLQSRIRVLEVMKKTVRFDDQTMDRISTLEKELESSKKQNENLYKSKEELIKTYEKLLHEEDEERSIDSTDSKGDEEDSSSLENTAPTFGLRHTPRRPFQAINRANTQERNMQHLKTEKGTSSGPNRRNTSQMTW